MANQVATAQEPPQTAPIASQARQVVGRLEQELMQLLEGLQVRIGELEDQLGKERAARQKAEADAEENRRWMQRFYVQLNPPTEEDIEFWHNAKPSDFTVSSEELRAMIDELAKEP